MAYYLIKKAKGACPEAEARAINWLTATNDENALIHIPYKKNFPYLDKKPLDVLKKNNQGTINGTTVFLCFGPNGGSKSGNVPAAGSQGKILLFYTSPASASWLLERFSQADFCLLPWTEGEAENWCDQHTPFIL